MFHAAVLRADHSLVLEAVEIRGQPAKRGSGDGRLWRGVFKTPSLSVQPAIGDTLQLQLDGQQRVMVVVTAVAGTAVHFRAPGSIPSSRERVRI